MAIGKKNKKPKLQQQQKTPMGLGDNNSLQVYIEHFYVPPL